jgi:histidine phosphotransfer protein HptB
MSTASASWVYSSLAADPDLRELVELFVEEMPERIENLIRQYQEGVREDFRRAVHQIKGAGGSYGFHALTQPAAQLEMSLKTDRAEDQIQRELDELLSLCRRVRSGLPE